VIKKYILYVGTFALVIIIPAVATERASTEFIFTRLNTDNGMGIHDKAYILALGLLVSQHSLIGYDASAKLEWWLQPFVRPSSRIFCKHF